MPELPEVQTTVDGINRLVKGRKIVRVWSDWPKYFKLHNSTASFEKYVSGRKIVGATRRGKNILIELSGLDSTDRGLILIHQKMSGHLLYGLWTENPKSKKPNSKIPKVWEEQKWVPSPATGKLADPKNRFIRLIFFLDNQKMLALSDLRRFAKVLAGPKDKVEALPDVSDLGPEPLEISFADFKKLFRGNPSAGIRAKRGTIKQVLLDQSFIVGIGNIYADEVLYSAKIHPLSRVEKLGDTQLKAIWTSARKILKKSIKLRGTSIDDFRDPKGKKGRYGDVLLVYQKTGRKCPKGHTIERIKVASRSTHFCPVEQKLYR